MKLVAWGLPVALLVAACGTVEPGQGQDLSIETASLPDAVVGRDYRERNVVLQARGAARCRGAFPAAAPAVRLAQRRARAPVCSRERRWTWSRRRWGSWCRSAAERRRRSGHSPWPWGARKGRRAHAGCRTRRCASQGRGCASRERSGRARRRRDIPRTRRTSRMRPGLRPDLPTDLDQPLRRDMRMRERGGPVHGRDPRLLPGD